MGVIVERICEVVAGLPEPLQQQVLEYAQQLSERVALRGIPLADLQAREKLLSDEDADAILHAVETGCEQVNPDEW